MKELATSSQFSPIAANINLLWGSLFIEELIRHDILDFCIAPGSRSTPLTLAVANHPKANTHIHFDERGLGFLALGISQAKQKPVVVITTSGSAVANLYPAVIEARQSGSPLIVISADRPATLLDCGANQAIDQHSIFSSYPLFFKQIVQPSTEINANYLLTTLAHGLNIQQQHSGPIHFNIAFAEPLYPSDTTENYQQYLTTLKNWRTNTLPFTQYRNVQLTALSNESEIKHNLSDKKVLFVLAKMKSHEQAKTVAQFCQQHNIPLLADVQSSQGGATNALTYYDLLLVNDHATQLLGKADLIIQFGEQLISKRLSNFMQAFEGELQLVNAGNTRIDPNHQLDIRFNCVASIWLKAQKVNLSVTHQAWSNEIKICHNRLKEQIITPFLNTQPFSEITVVHQLDTLLINANPLFIGNSMPIRLADMFMGKNDAEIYSNRGTSGIDGLLASAIGVAKGSNKPTTLLIGDSSFLYDLNSLALLKQLSSTFIIIVINNDGGAIFNLLPVPSEQRERLYQLPHGLNFKASCQQFAIDYHHPEQINDFKSVYNQCLAKHHSLIEISVPNQQCTSQLDKLKELISNATL